MARADTPTLLPLDQWAKIIGINPMHFNGGRVPDVSPEPFSIKNAQNPIWHQFGWQAQKLISREVLARTISEAELEISKFVGYWVAPTWVSQEIHNYPRHHRPEAYGNGFGVRAQRKNIKLKSGRVIEAGRRATTLIATPTVTYSDPNSDGFDTLATITAATTLTDTCEIKLYFTDENGDEEWEIRPLKSIAIAAGVVTITVDSWLLFDPDLTNSIVTEEVTSIDATATASYVTTVEVRREFNDFTTVPNAQFFWQREPKNNSIFPTCTSCGGSGCEVCTLISQDGCFQISDVYGGLVVPIPATYDTVDERWEEDCWTECREPDQVKLWYRAGEQSERGLRGGCDKLDKNMARLIAILAATRLNTEFHANNNVNDVIQYWQRDMAESTANGSVIFTPPSVLENPFGARRGEVEVWRQLRVFTERRMQVATVAA